MESSLDTTIDYTKLYKDINAKLRTELPAYLFYHNLEHTLSVLDATEKIAFSEDVGAEEMLLLKTAALLHDAGFLKTYTNHEQVSCEIAMELLPAYGYTSSQIERICGIIMATKLPQRPKNKLEQIICDADLHYLGTENYFEIAEKLYTEYKKKHVVKSRKEWQQKQILFLGSHRFFTSTARQIYDAKKEEYLLRLTTIHQKEKGFIGSIQDIVLMVIGVLIAGFALNGFLVPNLFFDGGLTGISLLLHELYHINLAYVLVAINLPFIIAGYFSFSKKFAYKSLAAAIMLGLCLLFIPYPTITSDKLLISIFGGVFLGLGIGLTMRAGCALDGIEVLALYTLKRTSFTITEIILGLNILIFSVAAFKFGMETALYSVLTYFAASRMIDYVIEGIQAYTGVTIISGASETIKHQLVNELGRGITIYKGERGYLPGNFDVSADCDIIFTVVTRLELRKLKNLVYGIDSKAFVFATTIREASGGVINRKTSH